MGALDGMLVVAFEQAVAAPLCTVRLADAGARVIKIERREGDLARHYDTAVDGMSAYFAWLNRGKESLVLDIKDPGDLALLFRLVERADVFVQNFAPGAAARLGLDARTLSSRHPRLVAVDIAGYGSDTAAAQMRAYDMLVQAEAGVCSVTGTADTPVKVGVSIADIGAGMNAHAAVVEALLERTRTNRGRAIEMTLFDTMAEWMAVPLLHYRHQGTVTPRTGLSHAIIQPYSLYDCADGQIVIAVQNHGEWKRLCAELLLQPDLAEDARFNTIPLRNANRGALEDVMHAVLKTIPRSEAIRRLDRGAIAWGRVSTVPEVAVHPALRMIDIDLPTGRVRCMAPPLHRDLPPRAVPVLDQHGAAIRREFAA
jgi:crotonobetainyl-CoA:carnitine CoA-transferase CaiB-like acyl-CoA transferase